MLRLVWALVANLILLALLPLRLLRRAYAAPRGAWVEVEIDGGLAEVPRQAGLWAPRPRSLAIESLRRLVKLVAEDRRVAGLLFSIKHLRAGSATATSLRQVLADARAAGKRVAVYLPEGGGTRETFVATGADLIIVGAETHLTPMGYAVQAHYLKGLFDKLGVEPDVLAKGRYKTAGEPLTRTEMSEAQKEQLGAVLDVAWDTLLEAIASGRRVDRATAERWVNEGPWSAKRAVDHGLADAVAYPDEVKKKLLPTTLRSPRRGESKDGAPIVAAGPYARRRRLRFVSFFRPPRIGVVEVLGPIVSAEPISLFPMAVEKAVVHAATRALEDPRVRGVVLHVDSRGGSALASDRMLHAIRKLAEKKPVVAYMGDTAASGGYMVAVGAALIVAQPTTVTGSIGVVAARFVLEPLMEKLGIGVEVLKRGERADMLTASRRLDPAERAALEQQIDDIYRSFLEVVARGRGRSVEEIEPLAGGRVWSGRDALAHGLVDKLGGFDLALAELRQRIGPGAERLEPVVISPPRMRPPPALLPRLLWSRLPRLAPAAELAALCDASSREPAWAWCELTLGDPSD
jgi:protease-4